VFSRIVGGCVPFDFIFTRALWYLAPMWLKGKILAELSAQQIHAEGSGLKPVPNVPPGQLNFMINDALPSKVSTTVKPVK
jgi:hypothetical protein